MNSLYKELANSFAGKLEPQIHTKSTLTVLSHALEDAVLASNLRPLIFTAFQDVRYFNREQSRYSKLMEQARAVIVYGKGLSDSPYQLENDWFVIINEPGFKAMLASHESNTDTGTYSSKTEAYRPFEVLLTYDAEIVDFASRLLAQQTLPSDSPIQATVSDILAKPHQPLGQARLVQLVGVRILEQLEQSNLWALHQLQRNQELISSLEQQQETLGRISLEKQSMENEQVILQRELKQLYVEFSRVQQLMTETFLAKTRLEQQQALSASLLAQLKQALSETDANIGAQSSVLDIVGKLSDLYHLNDNCKA